MRKIILPQVNHSWLIQSAQSALKSLIDVLRSVLKVPLWIFKTCSLKTE